MRSVLSTPFCRFTTRLPGSRCGAIWPAACSVSVDLTQNRTSCAPRTAAASTLASTGMRSSNLSPSKCRPDFLKASTWTGRPISVTGWPARASMPPKKQPTAPAPSTATRIKLLPSALARDGGAGRQRLQLRQRDLAAHRRHAAVGAGEEMLLRHILQCIPDDGKNFLGCFDAIAGDVDHAD